MDNKNNEAVDGVVASEEISLEEQQAVLEKFDQESNTRNVTGFAKGFIKWYAIAMAVLDVYKRQGYADARHFSKVFQKMVGVKPTAYRKFYV